MYRNEIKVLYRPGEHTMSDWLKSLSMRTAGEQASLTCPASYGEAAELTDTLGYKTVWQKRKG
ncbi:hypothetical protein AGATL06_25740 [Agathobaculum sp. TL06]